MTDIYETGAKVKVFSSYTNQHHTGYTVILDIPKHDIVVVSHSDDNKPHTVGRGGVIADTTAEPMAAQS